MSSVVLMITSMKFMKVLEIDIVELFVHLTGVVVLLP